MGKSRYNIGDQSEFQCSSDDGPDLEYCWSRNGANQFSHEVTTNTSTLVISNITTADGGDYTCMVTSDAESISHSVTIYGECFMHIIH